MDINEPHLSEVELDRYSRHLNLPEIGHAGQQRLKKSRVLVIGAGGLGSPIILYLAAAGVGTIGIADFDKVETSNLQRQILYVTQDVGCPKVRTAAERAREGNAEICIVEHDNQVTEANVSDLINNYDLVVDGSDNLATRCLVNDACAPMRKPYVYGSVHRFEGQVSVFIPGEGPCYRCVFKPSQNGTSAAGCVQAGVLGVLPGIVGTIQATECLKLLLSVGEPLIGRLLLIDALSMNFRSVKVKRDINCITCG